MKQEQLLLGFNKPGGFYSVLVIRISDEAVIAQDIKCNKPALLLGRYRQAYCQLNMVLPSATRFILLI